jgi:hypothetical protein
LRRLKATLNEAVLKEIEEDLKLVAPCSIVFRDRLAGRKMGEAQWHKPGRKIVIEIASGMYEFAKIRDLQMEMLITILHELRHYYQKDHWPNEVIVADMQLPYHQRKVEKDAEEWARTNAQRYRGLLKLSVRHLNTGLSRLGKTERSIRSHG